MSTLEKLIAQLCPDGVEYKPLGEIGIFFSGMSGVSNKWADQGNCRFIEYMHVYENARIDVTRLAFATVKSMNQTSLQKGDVLFTAASEVPEECAIAGEIEDEIGDGVFADDHLFGLRPKSNVGIANGYLKYAFQSPDFKTQITRYVRGVTRFYIAKQEFVKATIPLPPLPVQKEIVRMLDDMAGLIDVLEEELAARKKQYEWSRERLLKSGGHVEIKPLGEICDYSTKRIGASTLNTHTYTCVESMLQNKCGRVDAASVPDCGNLIAYEKGDVLIGNIRPYLKKIWLADVNGGTNGDVLVIQRKDKNLISAEYLYYVLSSDEFFLYDMQYAKGAKMPRGDKAAIMKYSVPVPSFTVQKEVVRILDEVTALIEAIENEITLRKQQYEYYRDKLLAFKRKPEVA